MPANNLRNVPLKTGEAVFFDHRLIHASTSNRSTDYRLAIGAVLLPISAPLRLGLCGSDGKIAFSDHEDNFILDTDLQTFAKRQK